MTTGLSRLAPWRGFGVSCLCRWLPRTYVLAIGFRYRTR